MRFIESARLKKAAFHLSMGFAALIASGVLAIGLERDRIAEAKAEMLREQRLAQIQREEREIVCLTNVTKHEAGGETPDVRELVAKVVLAIAADPDMRLPSNVCDLAKVPAMFSAIKVVDDEQFADPHWKKLYHEVSEYYYSSRALPRGWGCVRGFRVSDDKLEKLDGKQLHKLGFTVEAKGLKYFAARMLPVGTRGNITFSMPRAGCKYLTPTL